MNQYERIVSYIYRYDKGQKGMNVGFARVERRGQRSRITVQLRASLAQKVHEGYLFWQEPEGIRTIPMGRLVLRSGNFVLKADSDTESLFGTELGLGKMEGIFIDVEKDTYYATTWKNDSFNLGDWREWQDGTMGVPAAGTEDKAARQEQDDSTAGASGGQEEEMIVGEQDEEINGLPAGRQGVTESQGIASEVGLGRQRTAGGMEPTGQQEKAGVAEKGWKMAAGMGMGVWQTVSSADTEGKQAAGGMGVKGQQQVVGDVGVRGLQQTVGNVGVSGQQQTVGNVGVRGLRPAVSMPVRNGEAGKAVQEIKEPTPGGEANGLETEDAVLAEENEFSPKREAEEAERKAKEQSQADMQIQSICSACPFKRKNFDYGKKILMTFPSMKPFSAGIAKACVRMELQDIGCLPVASWQLAGNRFLLHGYYCYRHLLFAQLQDGSYVLGVPGVFSDKERRNAARFGFDTFQAIGEPVATQGVFGYWLMDMQPVA